MKYETPKLTIEELLRVDVLMASGESPKEELENAYGSFAEFVIKDSSNWFD